MSDPNAAPASKLPKFRRILRSLRSATPFGLIVLAGLGLPVAALVAFTMPSVGGTSDLFAQIKEPQPGENAERHKGEEGKLGKKSIAENKTNRSAPKAIDITARDLVKNSGILAAEGGDGAPADRMGMPSGLYGSRVGDVGGFAGLGLRGTGTGGGGIGLGAIGTKGRGGGLGGYGTGAGIVTMGVRPEYPSEPMRAGATDDNADFDKFVTFLSTWSDRAETAGLADLIDVRDRHFVKVVDAKGLPIPTASVRILDQATQAATNGTTYGDGRLPFYPRANGKAGAQASYAVEARFGGQVARAHWDGSDDLTLAFAADRAIEGAIQLDVLFALDTTGSMGDEIDRIKGTLRSVTSRLQALPQKFDLRYGAVLYRDVGDEYVTRPLPFTSDVQGFMQMLRAVEAGGGGDTPESVNRALDEAVAARWRLGAAKVVFLIGDAPPHMDYPNDVRYGATMKAAVAKGIRVHSVAASGLDPLGTLVWRQVAQLTRGKFIFIEYGSAQATAESHGVKGSIKSNNLDDIIFEQVRDELEGWGKGEPAAVATADATPVERYAGPIQLHPRTP